MNNANRAKNIILDTDMGPDCDDAGALAILNKLADFGEANMLAVGNCTVFPQGACCADAINRYYGRKNVPVGTLNSSDGPGKGADVHWLRYNKFVSEKFDHAFKSTPVPDVTEIYRRTLSEAADGSVTFVTIGMLNNVRNLLTSPPDSYSPLGGSELTRRKIGRLVCMAGNFKAETRELFPEYNIQLDIKSTKFAVENFENEIVFCPYEAGFPVMTGKNLIAHGSSGNPVATAYQLYCADKPSRSSYDPITVYYAVRGTAGLFRESPKGTITVDDKGFTYFREDPNGKHMTLTNSVPPEQIASVLDELLETAPLT